VCLRQKIDFRVKSDLDALAPCASKFSKSFFMLETILVKRNSIEKQVAKSSENDGLQPLENIPESCRKVVWPNEFQRKNNVREQN
jgi:hypothetical protein